MSEKAPNQASSKEDLDQLAALEESMAPFGTGDLDSEHGVILKDWSAQDFANIYVRFRPHLISHARKFLRDETQAEEVVQDAFLYLMTALPELDSELGVLRFLKWKTKMLSLDIIRSSQAGLNNNLVPLPDDVADETQPLDSLERADDAAIIRLALAKLNPRHREALIATMYEEKSHEEVAQQMGVGENAFRQLLFRARASFRQALIGETSAKGLTVSDILALAHKRSRAGWYSSLTLVALVPGILFGYSIVTAPSNSAESVNLTQAESLQVRPTPTPEFVLPGVTVPISPVPPGNASRVIEPEFDDRASRVIEPEFDDRGESDLQRGFDSPTAQIENVRPIGQPTATRDDSKVEDVKDLVVTLGLLDMEALSNQFAKPTFEQPEQHKEQVFLQSPNGIDMAIGLNFEASNPVQYLWMTLSSEGHQIAIVPQKVEILSTSTDGSDNSELITILATDLVIGDTTGSFGGIVTTQSIVSRNAVLIDLKFNFQNRLIFADFRFSNRS